MRNQPSGIVTDFAGGARRAMVVALVATSYRSVASGEAAGAPCVG
jgi:hypothetical protein